MIYRSKYGGYLRTVTSFFIAKLLEEKLTKHRYKIEEKSIIHSNVFRSIFLNSLKSVYYIFLEHLQLFNNNCWTFWHYSFETVKAVNNQDSPSTFSHPSCINENRWMILKFNLCTLQTAFQIFPLIFYPDTKQNLSVFTQLSNT